MLSCGCCVLWNDWWNICPYHGKTGTESWFWSYLLVICTMGYINAWAIGDSYDYISLVHVINVLHHSFSRLCYSVQHILICLRCSVVTSSYFGLYSCACLFTVYLDMNQSEKFVLFCWPASYHMGTWVSLLLLLSTPLCAISIHMLWLGWIGYTWCLCEAHFFIASNSIYTLLLSSGGNSNVPLWDPVCLLKS